MARSLEQVLGELESGYAGTRSIYQTKLDAIPGEIQSGIAQADAKLAEANTNILDASRRRGLGFSGIPVGEQAKYAATDYAPAIANLKSAGKNQELGILEAMQGLDRDKRAQGQSIYDSELARDFQERQFAEQIRQFNENLRAQERAAAASRAAAGGVDLSRYLGGGQAAGGKAAGNSGPQMVNNGGSFAFSNGGKAITAAQYASLTGADLRDVLYQMGTAGDRSAAAAYNQLRTKNGNDLNATLSIIAKASPHLLGGYKPFAVSAPSAPTKSNPSLVKPTTNMLTLGAR